MADFPFDEHFPNRVKSTAERYFRSNLFNCAETVLKAVLEESGMPCPLETVRLASAFGRGMGGAGCYCGALVGGQMTIGALFGRMQETGFPPEGCAILSKQLYDRFVQHNRATCCRILHKGLPFGTPEQFDACAIRAACAAEITAQVIREAIMEKFPLSTGTE